MAMGGGTTWAHRAVFGLILQGVNFVLIIVHVA